MVLPCYNVFMTKSAFRENVYRILRTIPQGKVITYGQLAALAGKPKAARAIGLFMRTNPDAPRTPCHRVVASNGTLTGYSAEGGVQKKKEMLLHEGVIFKNEKVDLAISQWKS